MDRLCWGSVHSILRKWEVGCFVPVVAPQAVKVFELTHISVAVMWGRGGGRRVVSVMVTSLRSHSLTLHLRYRMVS